MITPEQLAKSGSEDGEHLALLCWCSLNFDSYPQLKRLVHIPNGGSRHKAEASKFKAMGMKPGFPDLFLPIPIAKWHGLFRTHAGGKGRGRAVSKTDRRQSAMHQ
jgi:hypothetical protein